jgi:hypothetical protein
VLYVATTILGGWIYPEYRLGVRVVLEQLDLWKANGSFELKEHFVAVGLGMLPAYWHFWRQPLAASFSRERAVITATLAFIVWWSFAPAYTSSRHSESSLHLVQKRRLQTNSDSQPHIAREKTGNRDRDRVHYAASRSEIAMSVRVWFHVSFRFS